MTYQKMKEILSEYGYDLSYKRILIGSKYTLTKVETKEVEEFFSKKNLEDYVVGNIIGYDC